MSRNLLARMADRMDVRRKSHASSPVTYRPIDGSGDIDDIAATKSHRPIQVPDADGFMTVVENWDFLISVEDLAALAAEPVKGDRIIDGDETFEVCPLAGLTAFERVRTDSGSYRIHTKRITVDG